MMHVKVARRAALGTLVAVADQGGFPPGAGELAAGGLAALAGTKALGAALRGEGLLTKRTVCHLLILRYKPTFLYLIYKLYHRRYRKSIGLWHEF